MPGKCQCAVLLSLWMVAGPAAAEEPAAPEAPGEPVTGSHLRHPAGATPFPVLIISREDLLASGRLSIGDFLQELPQQGNAMNSQYGRLGDGSTTVSLRSLGSERTLVLVNGRRVVAAAGIGAVRSDVDLGAIPLGVVERIEILTDAASAVYGSGAVAGVVNVVTRRGWSGTEASAAVSTSSRLDGTAYDLSATAGRSSDRGNLLVHLAWLDSRPVDAADRAWSRTLQLYDYTSGRSVPAPGSTATPAGRFRLDPSFCSTSACAALLGAYGPGARNWAVDPAAPGGARPYVVGADAYDFHAADQLVAPERRLSAHAAGDLALGALARGSLEATYVSQRSSQTRDPWGFVTIGYGAVVSGQSYYNPYGVDLADVRRALVEAYGDRRTSTQDSGTFRAVAALDGSLPAGLGPLARWRWEAALAYGRSDGRSTFETFRIPSLLQAIGPSFLDTDGVVKCGAPGNVIAGCVPLDLLHGRGSITPAQAAGIRYVPAQASTVEVLGVQAGAAGELGRLLSERPVLLAVGAEVRTDSGSFRPDPVVAAFETTYVTGPITRGSRDVIEGHAELALPLWSRAFLVDDLSASAAARLSRHPRSGNQGAWTLGLRYAPLRDLALRATASRAFLAPGISQLFSGATDSFPSLSDPCSTDPGTGAPRTLDVTSGLYAQCNATGVQQGAAGAVTANNGDDRIQQRARGGGNPALEPETAQVLTLGLVLEPRFVPRLSLTLGYHTIDVSQAITTLGAGLIVSSCFTASPYPGTAGSAGSPQRYCNLIHRSATGQIDHIDDVLQNAGGRSVSGVDFGGRYSLPTAIGRFDLAVDGTWLLRYDTALADGTVVRGQGNYDFQKASPTVRANAGVFWSLGGLGAGAAVRYVGTYRECDTGFCTVDPSWNPSPISRTVASWSPIDLSFRYRARSAFGQTVLRAGVLNLLDERPPAVYSIGFLSASEPSTYDFPGRSFQVRLSHEL